MWLLKRLNFRPLRYFIFFLPELFLSSCKPDPLGGCFTSSGPGILEYRRLLQHPDMVELRDNVDVRWHYADSAYLVVHCPRNLRNNLTTDLQSGRLTIRNKNRCNWVRSYYREMSVDLYSRAPQILYLKGYGTFTGMDTMQVNDLALLQYGAGKTNLLVKSGFVNVDFNCVGEMTLAGRSTRAFYYTQNVGKFRAENLETDVAEIKIEGDNALWVNAEDTLKGTVYTSTSVFFRQNPHLSVVQKKGGKVLPMP